MPHAVVKYLKRYFSIKLSPAQEKFIQKPGFLFGGK